MSDSQLQLEALKLLQQWSMWLITITSVFLSIIGYTFKNLSSKQSLNAAKYCIGFFFLSLVFAIFLVGAIPANVQKIGPEILDNEIYSIGNARGIYGLKYLGFIPLWVLSSGQRISFLIALIFGMRLVWQNQKESDSTEK